VNGITVSEVLKSHNAGTNREETGNKGYTTNFYPLRLPGLKLALYFPFVQHVKVLIIRPVLLLVKWLGL
jgi:hypothetical protein